MKWFFFLIFFLMYMDLFITQSEAREKCEAFPEGRNAGSALFCTRKLESRVGNRYNKIEFLCKDSEIKQSKFPGQVI